MTSALVTELPYYKDSAYLFEAIAHKPWAVFLDSGHPAIEHGRYDIIAAEPMAVLLTRGDTTTVQSQGESYCSLDDPFDLLRNHILPLTEEGAGMAFNGGAIGYFGYDIARRLTPLPCEVEDDEQLPDLAIGIYDWALVIDHQQHRSCLVGQGRDPLTRRKWSKLVHQFRFPDKGRQRDRFRVLGEIVSNMDQHRYSDAFRRIKHYIREGDCYQVNLARRYTVPTAGDPWLAYQKLRCINPAPFSAYLNIPGVQVLSTSPERFLRVKDSKVETMPIKGTRPRSTDPTFDRQYAEDLCRSAKDRAENLMIVDLLRNDISKSCATGTVKVPKLFELQSFATLHHLVSTVTGQLSNDRDALHLLRDCFPGGSITGAPKLRAMQIIEELETHRRGVYCGSIGYIGFDGAMDSNIAIRTLVHAKGRMSFWAGGGIVADSSLEGEYQESIDKATALFELLTHNAFLQRMRV